MQMILNRVSIFNLRTKKSANTYLIYIKFITTLFLIFFLFSDAYADTESDKNYLRIEQNKSSVKNDYKISSIGALAFKKDILGHVDLTYFESEINGSELALELGGGYVFNGKISLFLGVGVSIGYNQDKDDFVADYFPEAGVVLDVTPTFGFTANVKRYYKRYEKDEDIVMFGLVFRSQ